MQSKTMNLSWEEVVLQIYSVSLFEEMGMDVEQAQNNGNALQISRYNSH